MLGMNFTPNFFSAIPDKFATLWSHCYTVLLYSEKKNKEFRRCGQFSSTQIGRACMSENQSAENIESLKYP